MSRPVHLGLDVGGTASRWVACDGAGHVLARGEAAGATGHMFNPAERERLRAALGMVASSLEAAGLVAEGVTAGITGFGAAVAGDVKALVAAQLGASTEAIAVTDDIVLAYMALFAPGQGHLISAGTGSIGLHVASDGAIVRVGGRGILIDDAGSGSWIALQALDRMFRELDHTGSFDRMEPLARNIFSQVGGRSWHDVRQFVYAGDRGRIGTLAVAVAHAAREGDETALIILRRAGVELAQLAKALLARSGYYPVRLVGGVLQLSPVIIAEVARCLPDQDIATATADAALAAAQSPTAAHASWRDLVGHLSVA